MKKIRPEDLPVQLTDEVINILVTMAIEFPKRTFDWANVSKLLEERGQLQKILDKVEAFKVEQEKARCDAMTEEEKADEAAKWERIRNDPDPYKFWGNMGQPETPQEYKNRYGVWPLGYNEEDEETKK